MSAADRTDWFAADLTERNSPHGRMRTGTGIVRTHLDQMPVAADRTDIRCGDDVITSVAFVFFWLVDGNGRGNGR